MAPLAAGVVARKARARGLRKELHLSHDAEPIDVSSSGSGKEEEEPAADSQPKSLFPGEQSR